MEMKLQQWQFLLILLSLICSATLLPDMHGSDSGHATNISLGNVTELRDALRKIERFIETEEIASALQGGN